MFYLTTRSINFNGYIVKDYSNNERKIAAATSRATPTVRGISYVLSLRQDSTLVGKRNRSICPRGGIAPTSHAIVVSYV